jgi:hypothetical protein
MESDLISLAAQPADNAPKRGRYLALAVASGLGLPLAALAFVLLFNPYALLLSASFTVRNDLAEPALVTPLAGVRLESGEHRWKVLPRLALPFLAAPAYPRARIPVAPGETLTLRANFDDGSLAVLAVETASAPDRAMLVDREAAAGGCCYPPRNRALVLNRDAVVPVERRMLQAVREVDAATPRALGIWYGIVACGLGDLALFVFALRRYRALRPGGAGSARA